MVAYGKINTRLSPDGAIASGRNTRRNTSDSADRKADLRNNNQEMFICHKHSKHSQINLNTVVIIRNDFISDNGKTKKTMKSTKQGSLSVSHSPCRAVDILLQCFLFFCPHLS